MVNWLHSLQPVERVGEIEQSLGLKLVANGPPQAFVGELCEIIDSQLQVVMQAEVVGFDKAKVFLMPFSTHKISMGFKVRATGHSIIIPAGEAILGRIVDAFVQPLDNLGEIQYSTQVPLHKSK
ncbi:hypothetical protein [Legionella sp.]|nr:hypothetical protein [Legionella sp.]